MTASTWNVLLVAEADADVETIRVLGRKIWGDLFRLQAVKSWNEGRLALRATAFDVILFVAAGGSSELIAQATGTEFNLTFPPILIITHEPYIDADQTGAAGVLDFKDLTPALLRYAVTAAARQMQLARRLLDSLHDVIIATDEAGVVTLWNTAAETLTGWPAAEAVGQQVIDLLGIDAGLDMRSQVIADLEKDGFFQREFDLHTRDGRTVTIESNGIALYSPDGQVRGLLTANRDVTRRNSAEDELKRSHDLLQEVLNSLAEFKVSLDRDWRFTGISPEALKALFHDRNEEELLGKVIWDEFPQLTGGAIYRQLQLSVETDHPLAFEEEITDFDRWFEVHCFPSETGIDVYLRDITRRKQDQQERDRLLGALERERNRLVYLLDELRQSEEMFRMTFENASVGISHVGLRGEWLMLNNRLAEILGYSHDELLQMTFQQVTHPEDLEIDLNLMQRVLRGETENYQIEKRYIHKDGSTKWIHLSTSLRRDLFDQPLYFISVIQDITRRKQLEAHNRFLIELGSDLARAESKEVAAERAARGVAQQMGLAHCLAVEVDPERGISRVIAGDYHQEGERFAGDFTLKDYPPGLLADLRLLNQVEVGDIASDPRTASYFETMFAPFGTQAIVHSPFAIGERWSGMLTAIARRPHAWNDEDLNLLQSAANLLGLTLTRIHLLENLRASDDRMRLAMAASGLMVFEQDQDLRYTFIYNPYPYFEGTSILGKADREMLPAEEAQFLEDLKREAMETGERRRSVIKATLGGKLFYYDLVVEPNRNAAGQITGIIGSALDITERHAAEDAISAYATKLERSNRDLEDFAFIASHDLQEPLRKVRSFGKILLAQVNDRMDFESIDYLQRMYNASERMQRMIDDLLAYSRVSTHGWSPRRVNLTQVVRDVMTDLELRVQQTGGRIEVGALPEIEVDRAQIQQLFQNLIGNALKFNRPGVPPVVRISARHLSAHMVEISVSDNGVGFAEEHLSRIFQPFTRLHGQSEYEGSGIGLAICRKIAERHGGGISAHSTPGEGSEFFVLLPVKQT